MAHDPDEGGPRPSGRTDRPGGRGRRVAIVRCREVYELALRREATAYQDAGFEVDIFMLASDEERPGVERIDGATVHRLKGAKSRGSSLEYLTNYGTFIVRAARALTREHRRRSFCLVQVSTMPDFLFLCTLWLRLRGVKVAMFMKEPTPELGYLLYGSRLVERALRLVERCALRYSHVAFTVTSELRQTYIDRGADGTRIHVVQNTPDEAHLLAVQRPPRVDPDRFVLVCHGTIEHRWGYDVMIRAVDLVRDKIPEVQLRLPGSGDYAGRVEALIAELGLEDHVVCLGWLPFDELVSEVAGARAGIVAQLASPYSHVVHTQKMYEFIMLGVPCIASRLRATAASFEDGELLYYEPDDPQSLAEAIIRLHDDPDLAASLVSRARARYESCYRWAELQKALIDPILEVVGDHG